jgi:putative membrane protein insertion efficiency factor
MLRLIKKIISLCLLALIGFYRYVISPVTGSNCRYYPSCSSYAEQAIREYGPLNGCKMALLRILRCRPGMAGGLDPVPGSSNEGKPENNGLVKPQIISTPESAR